MIQARPRERFAWCLFDFANSAFNTVVLTFVFATFFAKALVGDPKLGDILWSVTLALSGIVVAVVSPFLGTLADRTQKKRAILVTGSLVCIVATALLFFARR